GAASTTFLLDVNNAVPAITSVAVDRTTIVEGEGILLSGVFTDAGMLDTHTVEVDWGDGTTSNATVDPISRTLAASHVYLDDDPTDTPGDTYTIAVTVTDDDGASTTNAATVVRVQNVAPSITETSTDSRRPGDKTPGDNVVLTAVFTDSGLDDTHTATVNWGDGTTTIGTIDAVDRTVSATHSYLAAGIYSVTLTVVDDDGGAVTATSEAVISGVAARDRVLYVIGTRNDDDIRIKRKHGQLVVSADFLPARVEFDTNAVDQIVARLGKGDDRLRADHDVWQPVIASGGPGNDELRGGHGNDRLFGGSGDDMLRGGKGDDELRGGKGDDRLRGEEGDDLLRGGTGNDRLEGDKGDDTLLGGAGNDSLRGDHGNDIMVGGNGDDTMRGGHGSDLLIGGRGADRIDGEHGDDLLIAGRTLYDRDRVALDAIMAEWSSPRDYATRVANLRQGIRHDNVDYLLQLDATVLTDSDVDELIGGHGQDWYFAAPQDILVDRKRNEAQN
ncbi:MAG: hypothetical protein D6753_00210, partial [Planctomycetota bacterium]